MNTITSKDFSMAIVVSCFNEEITEKLLNGAQKRLEALHFSSQKITIVKVPGAIEIPITAQRLALTKKYKAIVCLGTVIRGETTHYDYVCQQVSYGCQRIALDHQIPVIFGVLTTEDETQALERAGGSHGNKGADAIDAACEMVRVLSGIK